MAMSRIEQLRGSDGVEALESNRQASLAALYPETS